MAEWFPSGAPEGYEPVPDERAAAYQSAGHWRNDPLHSLLDATAAETPERPFLVTEGLERGYATVVERSRRIAAYLLDDLGLDPLDRVVLQLPNRPAFVELLFGCSRAGVVPTMVLPRHREAEADHVVELTDARAYVTVGETDRYDFPGMVDDVAATHPSLEHRIAVGGAPRDGWTEYEAIAGEPAGRAALERLDDRPINPADPAVFLLSGGTTGLPKVIPRTHNDYALQWRGMADVAGIGADWRTLTCGPIAHNGSIVGVLGPTVAAGATFVLGGRLKPEPLMATIDRFGVDYLWSVPTTLIDMLEHPDVGTYDLGTLSTVWSGGQKIPPRLVRGFEERYGVSFMNAFGMAEGPILTVRPDDELAVKTESVGRPLVPEADDCRIVTDDRTAERPADEPGELAARGPGYFTGYFRNPEANADSFDDDGWFYTEDVLSVDGDGNFRVHGRLSDTIIRGGENIYAPGVEDEIVEHPSVAHAAVLGMPDERLGERPMAYVELEPGEPSLTLEALGAFLDERGVAVFKRPERLEVLDALPRTSVEKIDKAALRARIEDEDATAG